MFSHRWSGVQALLEAHWIVLYAVALHGVWGVLLLSARRHFITTTLAPLARLGPPEAVGLLLLVVACLALAAVLSPQSGLLARLCMLAPQQAVLLASAFGAAAAIARGSFGDGAQRPRAFIAADQLPALLLACFHTVALFRAGQGRYHPPPRRR